MVDLADRPEEAKPPVAPAPAPSLQESPCDGGAQIIIDTAQTPNDETVLETRSMRSESSASRNSNRLSLTIPIPIALPTAQPTRPTPTSSTMSSYPSTPLDTPALMSPVDPNDFITAIAAQERRVLELREELTRAESELHRLKRQWANHEAHKKRAEIRNFEPLRPLGPQFDTPDDPATRRSVDVDRRKALLLGQQGQQSQQSTPSHQYRRRVFRGGHTRTLSLLSPTKPSSDGFAVHEDSGNSTRADSWKPAARETDPPDASQYTTIYPTPISKRASWAPRSVHQQASGVKQIAEDLKTGLWTFMEDLRQATVGEEPITGQGAYLRGIDGNMRSTVRERDGDESQDTIRASAAAPPRPHATSLFEYNDETPTRPPRFANVVADGDKDHADKEKENSVAAGSARHNSAGAHKMAALTKDSKLSSWKPLPIESGNDEDEDDDDWSSWDSQAAFKSSRWSGSTMNGDIITENCDTVVEVDSSKKTPSPKKKTLAASRLRNQSPSPRGSSTPSSSSTAAATATAKKLDELLPPVLNRLTPSNLKKTASDFMKEWEKSLSPPPTAAAD